jgi:hypothetical protein
MLLDVGQCPQKKTESPTQKIAHRRHLYRYNFDKVNHGKGYSRTYRGND